MGFLNLGYPQVIHFWLAFSITNTIQLWGYPICGNPQMAASVLDGVGSFSLKAESHAPRRARKARCTISFSNSSASCCAAASKDRSMQRCTISLIYTDLMILMID